ncbi:MAG: fibronectin type III domain-containing protein [Candidatus Thorarchaeota archaeon]|nr:fibronectin type III domain-containing protein [Candidatus Thorarchaeota archaeon]
MLQAVVLVILMTIAPLVTIAMSMDLKQPATIVDLAVAGVTENSITLRWTAPGNNVYDGNATSYVEKYSTTGNITGAEWDSATTYTQSWTPAKNGTAEARESTGLATDQTYWFAVIAYDGINYGQVSNSPSGKTNSPAAITTTTPEPSGNPAEHILLAIIAGAVVAVSAVYFVRRRQ